MNHDRQVTSSLSSRTHRTRYARLVGATAVAVLALAGCGDDDKASSDAVAPPASTASETPSENPSASAPADTVTGSLTVADQSGDGTSLTVEKVTIEGADGWIALHADAGGAPGAVAGFVQIKEGDTSDVTVKGDEKLATGDYWPMLHRDTGKLGTYEFGETKGAEDAPVTDEGKPVMTKITYTAK